MKNNIKVLATTLLVFTIFSAPSNALTTGQKYCNKVSPVLGFRIQKISKALNSLCMNPYLGTGWEIDQIQNSQRRSNKPKTKPNIRVNQRQNYRR